MNFAFKTTPFKHQLDEFNLHKNTERRAVFWEQGVGKTKLVLDTCAHLFLQNKINALLIVAPNGVHRNWISDEIPRHLMDGIGADVYCYHSSKASQKGEAGRLHSFLTRQRQGDNVLAVLAISYDGLTTKEGRRTVDKFLASNRAMYVLDEAHRIKNPTAKRTKAVFATVKEAQYRRALTGTPIANSPFDAYAIMKSLNLEFWLTTKKADGRMLTFTTFTEFKRYFGIFVKVDPEDDRLWAPSFCVRHENLNDLHSILQQHSSRVLKSEVLDLPPKLYTKRYFELNSEQQRTYNELRDEFITFLNDGEDMVSAPLVIQRLVRLQQITSGYLPCEGGDPVVMLGNSNPRLGLLEDVIEDVPGKSLIFCKFTKDVDQIMDMLASVGRAPVRYDGSTGPDDRAAAIDQFQKGGVSDFVANVSAASEGLTLHAADTVIYYNNSFNLVQRLQSEDRAHRIGQTKPVTYIDLAAENTVDEDIVDSLVKKQNVSATVLGDVVKGWL